MSSAALSPPVEAAPMDVAGIRLAAAARPQRWPYLRRTLARAAHRALQREIRYRHDRHCLETVTGHPILVVPGVLNPVLMRSGAYFAGELAGYARLEGARVLDMGTGSGVCAVVAARRARRVVAADINPVAVSCARANVELNGLTGRVEVVHSDLFERLPERRFEVVLFNPPFLEGRPADAADAAWRSPDVAERFASDLRDHLEAGGEALLLLSTFGSPELYLDPLRARGFALTLVAAREFFSERLLLVRAR